MTDLPSNSGLLHFLKVPNYPNRHWSVNSGWEQAICLAEVDKEDVKEKIRESNFIAFSLDEVMAVENTSWVCMHVYTVQNHSRQLHLLSVAKMKESVTTENLFQLVKRSLIEYGGMNDITVAKKMVCVGADGASVMQGHRNNICTKIETSFAQYITVIHYIAHIMNLGFGIVSKYASVKKIEILIRELYSHFCRSPKRFMEFQHFADGIIDGNKLLKDNDTRSISLDGLAHSTLR